MAITQEPETPSAPVGGEVSRRSFMKGIGSVVGAAAIVPSMLRVASAQDAPAAAPLRAGIRRYKAAGQALTLKINGKEQKLEVQANATLLDTIREKAGLTGCKEVCSRGACGGCTVMVDGRSVNSCMMLAVDAEGHEITTVEGLIKDGQLDPVQAAFCEHDASQCGYCIPGFVMRSRVFLNENPKPTLDEIKHGLSGNICRCSTYIRIFAAVTAASQGVKP